MAQDCLPVRMGLHRKTSTLSVENTQIHANLSLLGSDGSGTAHYRLVRVMSLSDDAPFRIVVGPADRAGGFEIGASVAHEFSSEILDQSEDATSDDFVFPGSQNRSRLD